MEKVEPVDGVIGKAVAGTKNTGAPKQKEERRHKRIYHRYEFSR